MFTFRAARIDCLAAVVSKYWDLLVIPLKRKANKTNEKKKPMRRADMVSPFLGPI
jgi:hypothetical protein